MMLHAEEIARSGSQCLFSGGNGDYSAEGGRREEGSSRRPALVASGAGMTLFPRRFPLKVDESSPACRIRGES
jgi:hypothetical protein